MGWDFVTPLTTVQLSAPLGVDGVSLVGIDCHAEQAGVGLYRVKLLLESSYGRGVHISQMKNENRSDRSARRGEVRVKSVDSAHKTHPRYALLDAMMLGYTYAI